RKGGAKLEAGWPPSISPSVRYDANRDLLWATFAFLMREDQVDALRVLAAREENTHRVRRARAWTASPPDTSRPPTAGVWRRAGRGGSTPDPRRLSHADELRFRLPARCLHTAGQPALLRAVARSAGQSQPLTNAACADWPAFLLTSGRIVSARSFSG